MEFSYRNDGRANFTGEVNRNFSEQAGEVFNRTLQNGTIGDLEVDPFILTYVEHQSGKISSNFQVSSIHSALDIPIKLIIELPFSCRCSA